MTFRIPKYFYIHGHKIDVKINPCLNKKGHSGESDFRGNRIELSSTKQKRSLVEETFCHELMHFVFCHAAQVKDSYVLKDGRKLTNAEDLVEICGRLLHQAMVSSHGNCNCKRWN